MKIVLGDFNAKKKNQFNFFFDAQNLSFVCDSKHVISVPDFCKLQEKKSRGKHQALLPLLLPFSRPEFV